MNPESIISLQNLSCGYGHHYIIKNLSFDVNANDVVCLLGPNGVGKTTLFKTILGFLSPKGGNIFIKNKNISDMNHSQMAKHVAYVPQSQDTTFNFTAMEMVLMGRTVYLGRFSSPGAKDMEKAEEVMEWLGILQLKDKMFMELSGGQRQLVIIARALSQNPDVLIMDEPTSALDYGNQLIVLEQIKRLAKEGLAVIMTSHSPNHAFLCANRVILLQKNFSYAVGDVDTIISEKSLAQTYNAQIKITTVNVYGREIKGCIPIFDYQKYQDKKLNLNEDFYYGVFYEDPDGDIVKNPLSNLREGICNE